ncbi:MAG: hypothetical protein ACKO96_34970, partial [Flammeovirgaceae bacterium]
MEKNYLQQIGWLCWFVLISCLLLYAVPTSQHTFISIRKMDVLSDIRRTSENIIAKQVTTLQAPISKKRATANNTRECAPQLTCLEDFSGGVNMKWFFQSLPRVKNEPVRIAFFGDSFIEGDLLTASFRDTLQSVFGGRGVGFVPLASEVSRFRTSIQHDFGNMETYSIVGSQNEQFPLGFSGHCFQPLPSAYAEFKPAKRKSEYFEVMRLFYQTPINRSFMYLLNDTLKMDSILSGGDNLQLFTLQQQKTKSIRYDFVNPDSLKLYGAAFESERGIFVDNFSMRGNSGSGFALTSNKMLTEFNAIQHYKLIVMQYGLNVVSLTDSTNFTSYKMSMIRIINRLKKLLPETSFLLIGVSDRAYNQNGKFVTYPDIPLMRDVQREIAQKTGITFWDMYEAMGGENSIVKYVDSKPALAAKDYTHLTYWGGKTIAVKLANAILHERDKYAG